MRIRVNVGNGGKDALEKLSGIFAKSLQEKVRRMGGALYVALIFAVAGSGLWLAAALSGANTFSEIRPRLHVALAPLSLFFGGTPTGTLSAPPLVTAPGAIIALDELDVVSPVSARVVAIRVTQGGGVQAGDIVALLDESEAERGIRSARLESANAKLELERASTPTSGTGAGATLAAVQQAATVLADAFTNMPWVVDESHDILYGNDVDADRVNINAYADKAAAFQETVQYRETLTDAHAAAVELYRKTRVNYQAWTGTDAAATEAMLRETEAMLQAVVRALVSAQTFFTFVREHYSSPVPPIFLEHEQGINERAKTASDNLAAVNGALVSLAGAQAAPTSSVDLRDAQLRVEAAEHAVADAEAALLQYVVRARAQGMVARLDVRAGDAVVQGEVLATIASPQNVARIALGEADVVKVRAGQEAAVSFDAIEGLTISGTVLKVEEAALVADGRVTFYAYIGFPAGEERPKQGMSVTARIY